MKIILTDRPDKVPSDHFIHQSGKEPSEFKGPITLLNTEEGSSNSLLAIDESGKIVVSKEPPQISNLKNSVLNVISMAHEKVDESIAASESRTKNFLAGLSDISSVLVEKHADKAIEKRRAFFLKGKWLGDDLGSEAEPIRNIHSCGEAFGFRLENCSELPESSAKSVGRLFIHSKDEKIYADLGWGLKQVSNDKVSLHVAWPEGALKVEVDLSNECIDDARETIWQVADKEKDFERIQCRIKTPEAKKIIIEVDEPLKSSAVQLLGIE